MNIEEIIKSKNMIGANKPSYTLYIEDFISQGLPPLKKPKAYLLGDGQNFDGAYSNLVELDADYYLGAYITKEGNLEKHKIKKAELLKDDFKAEVMEVITDLKRPDGRVVIPVSKVGDAMVSLLKHGGKVYAFINDIGAKDKPAQITMLEDWSYSETIYETAPLPDTPTSKYDSEIVIPVVSRLNHIVVIAINSFIDNGYQRSTNIYASRDPVSKTWTINRYGQGGGLTLPSFVGQPFINNNGAIIHYQTYSSGTCNIRYSEDSGKTWKVEELKGSLGQTMPYWDASLFYKRDQDLLIKISSKIDKTIEVMEAPSIRKMLDYKWTLYYKDETDTFVTGRPFKVYELDDFIYVQGDRLFNNKNAYYVVGLEYDEPKPTRLPVTSIDINQSKGMVGNLKVTLQNEGGAYAPDGTANPKLLWPNKSIQVMQGYGPNQYKTFKGLIDGVEISNYPPTINIKARDMLKVAKDQIITTAKGGHTIKYKNKTIEYIWKDLAKLAGIEIGKVEPTGITVKEKEFTWESYLDAFNWLEDIAGYQTYADANGKVHFIKDGKPKDVVVKHRYKQGEDITGISYDIDDDALYYKVVVVGKEPDKKDKKGKDKEGKPIVVEKLYPARNYWNIPKDKILKIDASEADTVQKCNDIADNAIYLMSVKARRVKFEAIARPDLEIGDFIAVEETTTTISEIYRITDLSTTMNSGGYTASITCYHHGQESKPPEKPTEETPEISGGYE